VDLLRRLHLGFDNIVAVRSKISPAAICTHLNLLSVDSVDVLLATGHIAIDWWNDRTISYLMLGMHQRRWHRGERERERERERI